MKTTEQGGVLFFFKCARACFKENPCIFLSHYLSHSGEGKEKEYLEVMKERGVTKMTKNSFMVKKLSLAENFKNKVRVKFFNLH